ncbi:hypothetical protein GCM10007874_35740 [Labrys miyagiensis]|uniref:DUF1236 domain-containing protein n=2 Tax=Labrys miyagiensis TaxID=346912 RepID=A0ABQ6CLQ0_9HYPH|nr:hypothetical protein GCM10007874_35740 [Labrys miyagiensis]
MRSKLLVTVAVAAFSTVLAAGAVFAQDELIPKRKQQQEGAPPATQQEPANKMQTPQKKLDQSQQAPATEQPKPAEQAGAPAKKPVENTEQATPANRNQADTNQAQKGCAAGQEGNCQPPKTRKTGNAQPGTTIKPKTNLGQQQPEQPAQPQKKPMTGENVQQPATPGAKPDQTQAGTAPTGNRTDVDIVGSINVPKDRASQVRDRLFRTGERSDVGVNVNINVGEALPARVRPRPLPVDIVEIVPEYRNYDYVIIRDEIVIVEPQTHRVVEIIRKRGGPAHANAANKIRLTAVQRQEILRYGREHRTSNVAPALDVESGVSVPGDVELVPMPDSIVTEVPAIQSYDFFIDQNDEVVLVDPESHSVVEVIQGD